MKLKDKFKVINCKDCDTPYCDTKCTILAPSELIKLEEIADDFAIGFAEWTHNLRNACEKDNAECNKWENISNKELLKIYKKEKGL